MRIVLKTSSEPIISRSSSPSFGRCNPVATKIKISSLDMPAPVIVSMRAGCNVPLGTGRVISQIRMQAFFSSSSFAEGRAPHRFFQCFLHRLDRLIKRSHGMFANHGDLNVIRQIDSEAVPSVENVNFHICLSIGMSAFCTCPKSNGCKTGSHGFNFLKFTCPCGL